MDRILYLTVGEDVSRETLPILKKRTPQPYELTIWYDCCGRGINREFLEFLMDNSDDVVVLTKNHYAKAAFQFCFMEKWDYLAVVYADTVVEWGWMDKLMYWMTTRAKVGCVGCQRMVDGSEVKHDQKVLINNELFFPDGVLLFNRQCIDEIGGFSGSFDGGGFELFDWHRRARECGWDLISMQGIMKEIGTCHDGRNKNKNFDKEVEESAKTFNAIERVGRKNLKWWSSGFTLKT